jgi:heme exporter protein C
MPENNTHSEGRRVAGEILVGGLVMTGVIGATLVAPTEATMGDTYRILYLHVPMAWLGLLGFVVMATAGTAYLIRRDLQWDHWAHSAAELGWLCCSLTLLTGSLWAHEAWGTWWTWEPRLASAFVLWLIYSGCLILRASISDAHRRARLVAVLAIVGMLDIPLVVMATRWFRGIHPVSPELAPAMRVVLVLSVIGFTTFFATLLWRRRTQLQLEGLLTSLR